METYLQAHEVLMDIVKDATLSGELKDAVRIGGGHHILRLHTRTLVSIEGHNVGRVLENRSMQRTSGSM